MQHPREPRQRRPRAPPSLVNRGSLLQDAPRRRAARDPLDPNAAGAGPQADSRSFLRPGGARRNPSQGLVVSQPFAAAISAQQPDFAAGFDATAAAGSQAISRATVFAPGASWVRRAFSSART